MPLKCWADSTFQFNQYNCSKTGINRTLQSSNICIIIMDNTDSVCFGPCSADYVIKIAKKWMARRQKVRRALLTWWLFQCDDHYMGEKQVITFRSQQSKGELARWKNMHISIWLEYNVAIDRRVAWMWCIARDTRTNVPIKFACHLSITY